MKLFQHNETKFVALALSTAWIGSEVVDEYSLIDRLRASLGLDDLSFGILLLVLAALLIFFAIQYSKRKTQ